MSEHAIDLQKEQRERADAIRSALQRGSQAPSQGPQQAHGEAKLGELCLVAGGIAHDFNNALTVILGNAAMLERDLPGGSPERERVARIVGSARQASIMAEGLLSVASRESAKCVPLDLASWLEESEASLRPLLGAEIALEVEATVALPPILADASQLERLLSNLLANARDALGESPGRVTVRTGIAALEQGDAQRFFPSGRTPRGLCVYLEVENDGPMLRDEARARLFEPFFSTRPGALGLGLAAVVRIVSQHGAAIEVENEPGNTGRGVRFRVWFPAVDGN